MTAAMACQPSLRDQVSALSNPCRGRSAASEIAVQNRIHVRTLGSSTRTTANPAAAINDSRVGPSCQIDRRVRKSAAIQAKQNRPTTAPLLSSISISAKTISAPAAPILADNFPSRFILPLPDGRGWALSESGEHPIARCVCSPSGCRADPVQILKNNASRFPGACAVSSCASGQSHSFGDHSRRVDRERMDQGLGAPIRQRLVDIASGGRRADACQPVCRSSSYRSMGWARGSRGWLDRERALRHRGRAPGGWSG